MAAPKGPNNTCPVCGKPRGKGPDEFSHGKCLEAMAKTDGSLPSRPKPKGWGGRPFTADQTAKGRDNYAKKVYQSGKLPAWMYD